MGNRLVKFLTSVLPRHSQYGSAHEDLVEARDEVKLMLVDAGRLLGDVALRIDRLEWDWHNNNHDKEDGEKDGEGRRKRGRRRMMEGQHDYDVDDDDDATSESSSSCSDDDELESIIEGDEEVEDEFHDASEVVDDDAPASSVAAVVAAWEAEIASSPSAFAGGDSPAAPPSTPIASPKTKTQKTTKSILQTPTTKPTLASPRTKNRHRRVKFSPDVKPGKNHPPPLQLSTNVEEDDDDDHEHHHGDDVFAEEFDDRNKSISMDEEEHQTFLQMTQMEFVAGGSFDDGDADGLVVLDRSDNNDRDEQAESADGNDTADLGVTRPLTLKGIAVLTTTPTFGLSDGDNAATDPTDRALSDLTDATQELSVRVRRFETEEVDDAPTDEEHTDDEDPQEVDEFASAPSINDLSRSSILYESDNDDDDDNDNDITLDDDDDDEDLKRYRSNQGSAVEGSSEQLSFVHQVAIQNFHSDFHRSMAAEDDDDVAELRKERPHADDIDSDAADSWAQDGGGDGDDDDDFDTTTASENGDGHHDFGGDGFVRSELGFDGPLPTFPSDGRDPFFLDKEAPWPDQVEEFNPFDAGATHLAGGAKFNRTRTESASGTDADDTAQTMPSSSNSYDHGGDMVSIGSGTGFGEADNSVPSRLDYLESKLRALQQERLSEDHVVGDDEVEV